MGARRHIVDFSDTKDPVTRSGKPKSMTPKQIRARARRNGKMTAKELEKLYKPVAEWDDEELARGRPRNKNGNFQGASPGWMTRQVHEEAMARFKSVIEAGVRGETMEAMKVLHSIMTNDDTDERGKPIVPASTKLQAAQFLIEHAIGKPTQRQEVDISVRLQSLLATATVGIDPTGAGLPELGVGLDYAAAFESDKDIIDAEEVD